MTVHRGKLAALAAVTCAAAAAVTSFAMNSGSAAHRGNALGPGADPAQAASQQRGSSAAPLQVLSISPASSADPVTAADPVRVVFSAELAPGSPLPAFSPAVAGTWHAIGGGAIVFTPATPFQPAAEVTLRIPAGADGVRSAAGARLAMPASAVFQAGGRSTLRLEQLLAQLGYLPMTWMPQGGSGAGNVATSYTERTSAVATPAAGVLTWQRGYPSALTSQWQLGKSSVILRGALMAFQADHGLPMTGTVTSALWQALLDAAAEGQQSPDGYTYALVDKALPETITVWHDGRVVVHGLASTGTAATPTPDGTYPVYLRRTAQVMRGLMPDGQPYADPVQFVSYFNGDYAVHSMTRPSYGTPQSLGCVELPLSEARQVWPYLSYGSLVTVTG